MAKIKFRRDTSANWASANSVLSLGEPGLDITNNALKMGDGTTHWTNLQYIVPPLPTTPAIQYTGTFGNKPEFWRYTTTFPRYQYSSNGAFRSSGSSGYYWLDEHFDDQNYDLSGTTSIRFTNIGGIKGYFDFSDKSEIVMHTLDLGEIAVVDEWFNIAGFSNTLTTFHANNLIDVGSNFDIYGMQTVNGITLNFPVLDRITEHLYIDYNNGNSDYFANTAAPTFPALTYVGNGIQIYQNKYTSWSDFTSLRHMFNDFNFNNNTNNDGELFDGPGMPALTHLQYGNLYYYSNDGMQSISEFAALVTIDGGIYIHDNSELESFPSFPVLEYVSTIQAYNNPSMTTLDGSDGIGGWLPNILVINGEINFRNCGLTETSVNLILMKLAYLDGTNGTTIFQYRNVYIDQGTNAIPSGDGLTAKSTLEGRGCNVYVNS